MWPVAAWVGFGFGGCGADSEACGDTPPLCSDQALVGDCSDAVSEVDATCDGQAWVCDEGFHLADEIECTWPSGCEGAAPLCDNQPYGGQCIEDPDVVPAVCVGDLEWQCPEGYRFEGQTGCVPPLDCGDGPVPVCTDQVLAGECSDGVTEVPAECIVGEYACPDGYNFEDDVNCIPPAQCEEPAPSCFAGGDCGGMTEPAFCGGTEWICGDGFSLECGHPCDQGQAAPDECWDQGPGECSDTTQPPSCVEGFWSCPDGWDFGGFGEDCRFPG